jgi:hydrogenase expression/formation protein HypC
MCLAVPGKVLDIDRTVTPVMATVSFAGVKKQVCLEWLPDVQAGDFVIVHVGFALSKIDEEEAQETLRLLKEMGELGGEDQEQPSGDGSAIR